MTETKHPGDQHEVPQYEAHTSDASLKDRIKQHYEIASDYYYTLWYVKRSQPGEDVHHQQPGDAPPVLSHPMTSTG